MNQEVTYDDEISLAQLFEVLVRRQKLIYIVFGVIFFVGLIVALLTPTTYEYRAIIELPYYVQEGRTHYLQNTQEALALLNLQYIPAVLQQHHKKQPAQSIPQVVGSLIALKNENQKKDRTGEKEVNTLSGRLLLTTNLTPRMASPLSAIYQQILTAVDKGQQQSLRLKKETLQQITSNLSTLLANTKQDIQVTRSQIKQFQRNIAQLKKQAADEKQQGSRVISSQQLQNGSLEGSLLAQQMFSNMSSVTGLRYNTVPMNTIALQKQLSQLHSQETKLNLQLAETKNALASLKPSHFIGDMVRSQKPIKGNRRITVGIAALLGLLLGIMLAFLQEFVTGTVNPRTHQNSSTH